MPFFLCNKGNSKLFLRAAAIFVPSKETPLGLSFPLFSAEALDALTPADFEAKALRVFRFQAEHNAVYRRFLHYLGKSPEAVERLDAVPLMPIRFFKTQRVLSVPDHAHVFISSGTTGTALRSSHYITSLRFYHAVARRAFERLVGPLERFYFIGLLPSYLDNPHASLLSMVRDFMTAAGQDEKPFVRTDFDAVEAHIRRARAMGRQSVVFGVAFALLNWIQWGVRTVPDWIIETGGMKGQRRELVKEEFHAILREAFPGSRIISEYGMTELLSQAYSTPQASTRLRPPPWMRAVAVDLYDPLSMLPPGRRGRLGIIDLANQHSMAFIATDDLGIVHADGTFSILGRYAHAEVRGCNLLMAL